MKATVTLHQFPRPSMIANLSPFCMKVETFMQMASIPYEIHETLSARQAPQKKLPYILHQDKAVPDSQQIIEYLTSTFSVRLDAHLGEEQLAIGHAIRVMLEERLRWCIVYSRWLDPVCWSAFETIVISSLSQPYRAIFPVLARQRKQKIRQTLYANGIGRFTPTEIYQFGQKDITALASILNGSTYLFGDQPSSFDATVYAFLANLIDVPIPCPLNDMARQNKRLREYCQRMRHLYSI
ncbi:glutathione S-transferase family protein [Acaryochloris thomasi]|nr:glutathione S-transferase family protein [Acaryochloris thomasi]